ncbi:MAG: MarR family transcriptional regulator [Candidatus Omnitrophica bacterium]|nr:MarR family transcriptional regulator [Candidatus Omnitrophota bacterium]MDD5487355.1 MarR family transcriptional regulator [Candidatus Omnitrophota bacterium]
MNSEGSLSFAKEVTTLMPLILRRAFKTQIHALSKLNITLPQVIILEAIAEKGSCNMGELATVLELSMGSVTGIVDKMIEQGFVKRERSVEDRRIVHVVCLEKGRKALDVIGNTRVNAVSGMFEILDNAEKKEYLRILKKIYEGIRIKNEL